MQAVPGSLDPAEIRVPETNDDAADAAITDQQIRAAPENHERHLGRGAEPENRSQFRLRRRFDIEVSRTADAKCGLSGKRLVLSQDSRG
jgi:hypothetical protein